MIVKAEWLKKNHTHTIQRKREAGFSIKQLKVKKKSSETIVDKKNAQTTTFWYLFGSRPL